MAITRVWIEEGCISCGLSESNCPEVFKVETGEPSKEHPMKSDQVFKEFIR